MMKNALRALACTLVLGGAAGAYAQEAAPAAKMAAAEVSTPQFAEMAMSSGQFEIQSSEMALKKSENPDVKSFAEKMIEDHRKADKELQAALGGKAMKASVDPKHAKMLEQLQSASGDAFTPLYVRMQGEAHREAVALFRGYAEKGDDAKVKAFASKTLPTLEMHAEMVQKLPAAM